MATGSGTACLGNVQVLKLVGKDLGYDHTGTGPGANDGKVDTWVCDDEYYCRLPAGAYQLPTGSDAEWVDLFPNYVNVRKLEFSPWPNKNGTYAWRENDPSQSANPYVRIRITVGLAGKERVLAKKSGTQDYTYVTTVNLSDF